MNVEVGGLKSEMDMIEERVVDFVRRVCGDVSVEVARVLALASAGARRGHMCFDLRNPGEALDDVGEAVGGFEDPDRLAVSLRAGSAVGRPGDFRPFILERTRLYTHTFFNYETRVAAGIAELAKRSFSLRNQSAVVSRVCEAFPLESQWSVFRRVAAWNALTRGFCMITGGPGTGKTTSAAKILSLLTEHNPDLRIVPTAPTGKAAARLEEALGVGRSSEEHPDGSSRPAVDRAVTLHRLLGAGGVSGRFIHGPNNPIPADVIVVDEASMVDVPLMSHLLDALGPGARLILLGDHHQLASVQAGSLLADICSESALGGITTRYAKRLGDRFGSALPICDSESPLADCIVAFRDVYRFDEGIREVSDAVRNGDSFKAYDTSVNQSYASARFIAHHAPLSTQQVLEYIVEGYAALAGAVTPEQAFAAYGEFKVLCAVRKSSVGVESVNRLVENRLFHRGLLSPYNQFYANRPVLIQRNDHALGVFNGDIGIILPDESAHGELRAFFSSPKGGYRSIAPAHLPPHETAFALTVHKSQGSEFGDVLFLLPERDTPVLTRELVYTALTRARRSVTIAGTQALFEQAVNRPTRRASGLAGRLWGEDVGGGVQMRLGV